MRTGLACAVVAAALAATQPASAQYMFLDSNGDATNTSADLLAPVGSTVIDVWLDTNHDRSGTLVTCGASPMSLLSYMVCLRVNNGTVTWGSFVNSQPSMTFSLGSASSSTALVAGYGGQSYLAAGKYKLGSVTVTSYAGAPSILITPTSSLGPAYLTHFGSACPGNDFDNTLKLGPTAQGAGDWYDVGNIIQTTNPALLSMASNFTSYDASSIVSMAVADVNGDGRNDVVLADSAAATISVLLGEDTGIGRRFNPAVVTAMPYAPCDIALGDINGDGKADLAVAFTIANVVATFLSAGDGTFGSRIDLPNASTPRGISFYHGPQLWLTWANGSGAYSAGYVYYPAGFSGAITAGIASPIEALAQDVDRDGFTDVVTANAVGVVEIRSPLAGSSTTTMGSGLAAIGVTDLDGDNRPDLVTIHPGDDAFHVRYGLSGGGFSGMSILPAGDNPICLDVQDVNGDGRRDLTAVSNGEGMVSVMLNNGGGSFGAQGRLTFAPGNGPTLHVIADCDGNGVPDVVVYNNLSRTVTVHIGKGDGNFGSGAFNTVLSPYGSAMAVSDFTNDGFLDITVGFTPHDYLPTYYGTGQGQVHLGSEYWSSISGVTSLKPVELNSDGAPDLILGSSASSVTVLINSGAGAFGLWGVYSYSVGSGGNHRIEAADLDGDTKPDLAVTNSSSNSVTVLYGSGNGVFGGRVDYATGITPSAVTIADVNNDSRPDLIVANGGGSSVSVLPGAVGGGFGARADFGTASTPTGVVAADFDHNGVMDLAVSCQTGGTTANGTISVLLGTTPGSFAPSVDYVTGASPAMLAVGDLNADGFVDLVTPDNYSSCVSILLGVGDGTLRPKVDLGVQFFPVSVSLADFSRDGLPDIATLNAIGSTTVLLNRLAISAVASSAQAPGTNPLLEQNRPNPFNPRTEIGYNLTRTEAVRLIVFDVHGRQVRKLVASTQPSGRHSVWWDGRDDQGSAVGSGVYYYRLELSHTREARRMVLMR